ncbi:MAG: aminotransferase class I/II-fold pyridoxal phosphate-dependent enzyme [Desulfobacteraceae bacterium]|nr:MAG: aminotransferase class I/II-fold pyridoxal phosphate-dependent enzyme [Desulfobacteraceae bacterium]
MKTITNIKNKISEPTTRALRPFGTSIFTEMTALASEFGAVNLSQGFPDFEGPLEVRQKAAEAIIRGPNQYPPSMGIPSFRKAIARKMMRFYGVEVDPDTEITVTSGATEGLCATLLGILEPGDEVILIEPAYDSYAPISALAGAKIRFVRLTPPDFKLPMDELEAAFNPATKAILINTPQNPCGKVFTREELSFIGDLCIQHDCFAISDEVYEHLVYSEGGHATLLSIPSLRNRGFLVSSTAKTFSMTGWKQGYVIAAPSLSRAVRMSHQFITFSGQPALQEAMAAAIDSPDTYYEWLLDSYTKKRAFLCDALKELGFDVLEPEGSYYTLADVRPLGFDDDYAFCRMLPREAGVAAIPSSCFWSERNCAREYVRFCFCKKDETLEEGVKRLRKWLGK